LGRHHSTISRELKKAKDRHLRTVYWYDWAHLSILGKVYHPFRSKVYQ